MIKSKNISENLQDLPKWAQSEIRILQMRLDEAKSELLRIHDNPESNTILGSSYTIKGEVIKYLKNNQEITFILESGEISARIKKDYLEISAQSLNNNTDIYIRPHVSNVISIHLKK